VQVKGNNLFECNVAGHIRFSPFLIEGEGGRDTGSGKKERSSTLPEGWGTVPME